MFTDPRALLAVAAAAAPSLLAYNLSPSPTVLNQALALALWGVFVAAAAARPAPAGAPGAGSRAAWPVHGALALVALGVLWSWGPGGLPASLALSALGLLAAAALLVASGAQQAGRRDAVDVFAAFCTGWLVAGVLNVALAGVQVFAPDWPDGDWIAASGIAGRAVGNLRQPNHLSSLLLWSAISAVALVELRRLSRAAGALALAVAVFGVVLTASRTGLVSVLLLALWGLADRRLARPTRALLLGAPLIYAAAWVGMAAWAQASQHTFGGAARLAETDVSASRFGIWANTLALIKANPWAGVGFGEFNFAWSLTPFPGRPVAFFDHTHNLPLQLAVELGLPLAAAVMGLLLWALWRAAASAIATDGQAGAARRAASMMVLMIGLHSLLEYPLWYAYFLLPAAWAWGFALGGRSAAAGPGAGPLGRRALIVGGAALVVGTALSVADYLRVAAVFNSSPGAPPLTERISAGQRSVLFAHHADYAAVTSGAAVPASRDFDRATHYLLDTRLMLAWADALAREGRLDEARHVAARLREFRNPESAGFFAACAASAPAATPASGAASAPFQCAPPARAPGWREFMVR